MKHFHELSLVQSDIFGLHILVRYFDTQLTLSETRKHVDH